VFGTAVAEVGCCRTSAVVQSLQLVRLQQEFTDRPSRVRLCGERAAARAAPR
jgi:hypothetical protein